MLSSSPPAAAKWGLLLVSPAHVRHLRSLAGSGGVHSLGYTLGHARRRPISCGRLFAFSEKHTDSGELIFEFKLITQIPNTLPMAWRR